MFQVSTYTCIGTGGVVMSEESVRARGWLGRRPPASAHLHGLIVVALIAVTAIGVAGVGLSWFDVFGISGTQPLTDMSH